MVIGNMGSNALGDLTVQAVTHYGYDTGYSGGTQLSLPKLFPPSCVFAVAAIRLAPLAHRLPGWKHRERDSNNFHKIK